jgi:general nucleoside transport system permease protein
MALKIEPRSTPSQAIALAAPVIAVVATMLLSALLFSAMGLNGFGIIKEIFFTPLLEPSRWPDLGVKAAPLIIIAVGLSLGFRANVWNIGAEGQYVMGAVFGTGVALATWEMTGWWILPAMIIAGIIGGMLWAAIPALLRTRFNVSEILTSLMLTYVAVQVLNYLVRGPWKDPAGFNFPQTRNFSEAQTLPIVVPETLVHLGVPLALLIAVIAWIILQRTVAGFEIRTVGLAPAAARHAGFNSNRTIWKCLLGGGAMAGLAGILEAAGPFGQLTPQFPVNYGFTAIIVAFLGRLHPLAIVAAGVVMAVSYVGGEIAQTTMALPHPAIGIVQALMLFCLLALDMLSRYRVSFVRPQPAGGGA